MRSIAVGILIVALGRPLAAQTPARKPPAAGAPNAAPVKGATVEGITEYTLANGMRVLLFPDQSKPTTTVNMTVLVGSRSEGYGETGMAHLLEHMAFKGSPRHRNVPQELTQHGASPNGSTWYDRTNYFETFPAKEENLRWALDLETDRLVHAFIAKKDLESEMTVVRNEFESGENQPQRVLTERVMSTAYLWHNYGKSTIGSRADVEGVPIERLQEFYHKYYQPDNAVLVVAGKFDPAVALRLIQQTAGALPRPVRTGAMKIWPSYTTEPTQDGERTVMLRRVGDLQEITMGWHVPAGSHPDFAAIEVLADMLSNAPDGRLYQAVVATKKASSVSMYPYQLRDPGMLLAAAEVKKDGDVMAARDAMIAALDTLITTRPATRAEVDRAKTELLTGITQQLANSESVGLAFSEWASMGDWRMMFIDRDRIKQVTPDDVMRVAKLYLKASNRTVGIFIPEAQPDRAEVPVAPDITTLVAAYKGDTAMNAGEAFDASNANIDRRTTTSALPNGVKYSLLPRKTRGGTVTFGLWLDIGNEAALQNRGAVPGLTGSMLMRGSEHLTRQQIADTLNKLQTTGGADGYATRVTANLNSTREHLDDALRVVFDVMRHPAFDAKEFELLKQEQLAQLEAQRSDPSSQAGLALGRHLFPYPKGHPQYIGTLDEQIDDLKAATLDQVKAFYREFYGAGHGEIAIVGDFDPATTRTTIATGLADWKLPTPYQRIVAPTRTSAPLDITLKTPDKANAMFLAGKVLPLTDQSADYPALVLADYMLGGGFLSSRLATRIRQKDGLSYGVGTQFSASAQDTSAQFITYAIYAPQNRAKLEQAFNEEMLRAAKSGFTADEIAKAKEGWLESRKEGLTENRAIAGALQTNLLVGRSMASAAALEAKVNALTPAQLQAVVVKYLDPASMALVKAGDFDKTAPPTTIRP